MNIYLDNIIFYLQKAGGISVYWHELQRRFLKENEAITVIEQRAESKNIFHRSIDFPEYIVVIYQGLFLHLNRYLPVFLPNKKRGIFHSSYYRIGIGRGIVNIVTVHDFTYELFRSGLARWIHTRQKFYALHKADGIICISEHTKKDLLTFLPELRSKEIKVIYNGVGGDFFPMEDRKQEGKTILYVGDRKSLYKNFSLAVQTVEQLPEYSLTLVGGGTLTGQEIAFLDRTLTERYQHHHNVSSNALNVLYNQAFCLLYPSAYEGFGIPIIEAMKAGCPVISTNCSSIPEVSGNAALLVDEISVQNLIEKVLLLDEYGFRQKLIEAGYKQAEKFDWERCFQETKAFYKEIFLKKKA